MKKALLVLLAIGCTSKSSMQNRQDAGGDGPTGTGGAGLDAGSSDGSPDAEGCGPGFPVGATRPAGDGCNVCSCIGPGSWVCSTAACPIGGSGGIPF